MAADRIVKWAGEHVRTVGLSDPRLPGQNRLLDSPSAPRRRENGIGVVTPNTENIPRESAPVSTSCCLPLVPEKTPCSVVVPPKVAKKLATKRSKSASASTGP
jgi:hypothetical protein